MSVKTWIRALSAGMVFFFVAACSDDGNSSGNKKGGDGQEVRITHQDETLVADVTVNTVNTGFFEEGNKFFTTIIAGWVNPKDATFGIVTVYVNLTGAEGQPVGPGVYTLQPDDDGPMTARLGLNGIEMERVEDIAGILDTLVSTDGTVEVKVIKDPQNRKLERLELTFDGNFVEADLGGDPVGEEKFAIQGVVRVKK